MVNTTERGVVMIKNLLLLNELGPVDIGFFVACAVIIVLIVAVYFLIPVFNKKQYQEQRENLKKREDAFKSNKKTTVELENAVQETAGDSDDSNLSQDIATNEVSEDDVTE